LFTARLNRKKSVYNKPTLQGVPRATNTTEGSNSTPEMFLSNIVSLPITVLNHHQTLHHMYLGDKSYYKSCKAEANLLLFR